MEQETCKRCDRPFEQHPISLEWTCFTHGNPNGSTLEVTIWNQSTIIERTALMALDDQHTEDFETVFGIYTSDNYLDRNYVPGDMSIEQYRLLTEGTDEDRTDVLKDLRLI